MDGETVQHIEYVPFGEVFIEERNNVWNTPYLFNAKELDEETGLYYVHARYYDPRTSIWLSVDPIATYNPFEQENYLDGQHNGGVYNSFNLNAYSYCYQNPVVLIDPNGKQSKPIRTYTLNEYVKLWEQNNNAKMTSAQRKTLETGCIGVTALALGLQGDLTTKNAPPLKNAFQSFELAKVKAKQMELDIKKNPNKYPEGAHVVIFSKRFYASDISKYAPDRNGQVNMNSYDYKAKPAVWKNGSWEAYTNFDYGLYDPKTGNWWHANHAHKASSPMKVYESSLKHYSRPLLDFNLQIFVPAISTLPLPEKSNKNNK